MEIFFRHLKLEIALAIPASNEWKNSVAWLARHCFVLEHEFRQWKYIIVATQLWIS